MNDLIWRQDAIEAIVNTPTDVYSHNSIISVLDGVAFRQNEIIDIINALPSTQFKNHPCAECCETDCYCCRFIEYRGKPYEMYLQTDVECPNCGDMLVQRTDVVLTSNPPQYIYECKKCGWTGCNYGVR